MLYLLYVPVLVLALLLYFRLALIFNITDKPNHRSSHSQTTIRGGGIIFPLAVISLELINGFDFPFFTGGLLLITLISFYDDLRPLSNKIRLAAHLIAVLLLFIQVGLVNYSYEIIVISFIVAIGTINGYNFMDGINGITGAFSVLTILCLMIVNNHIPFSSTPLMLVAIIALMAFNFFNFRKNARCFAGDVGSISIAFFIIFLILSLILQTGNLKYLALLLIYGLDIVTTIVFRLVRKEDIFQAHRSHFYQYLANTRKWPHLKISVLYVLLQLIVNLIIIYSDLSIIYYCILVVICGVIFSWIRIRLEGFNNLLKRAADVNM